MTEQQKTVVNSWNDWDPLKHVIIGVADNCMTPPLETAVDPKLEVGSPMRQLAGTQRSKEAQEKANAQLDNLADILRKRGIRVDRPTPLDFSQPAQTPDWKVECMFGCMPPRDVLLTVGKEILEATMSYRCRWFEYLCYRPLLEKYF
ncbi:MAG: serine/threonine protein kinase, partial [Desulfobacterales bacterium]